MLPYMKRARPVVPAASVSPTPAREAPRATPPVERCIEQLWGFRQGGLEFQQTYIEAGLVPTLSLPGGARRGRVLLGLRATTPFGLYKLGDTSFTARLGEFGRGAGVALGGSTASRQACPRAT